MKYVCDACSRLVTVGGFSVEEDRLALICPVCGEESHAGPEQERRAPVLELARPRPPPQGPLCPKCGAPRAEERDSCARCGVVFALFKPENLALPAEVEALWGRVESDWNDTSAHEAFLDACTRAQALPEAARRYRIKAEQMPGDALASRYRDELVTRLMALSSVAPMAAREPGERASRPVTTVLMLAGFGALVFAFVYYLLAMQPWLTVWP